MDPGKNNLYVGFAGEDSPLVSLSNSRWQDMSGNRHGTNKRHFGSTQMLKFNMLCKTWIHVVVPV